MTPATNLAALGRLGFLTLPNYSLIACSTAIEACRMANRLSDTDAYQCQVVTLDGTAAPSSSGLTLQPTARLAAQPGFDILFVCGGVDVRDALPRPLAASLRRLARRGMALGALCTGAFALAEARLLSGYRCAIHWENLSAIREEFPGIDFVDGMFAIDRDRITCTGGVAPLDMMLALIGARLGPATAELVSRQFILERIRPGSDPQRATGAARRHPALQRAVQSIETSGEPPSLTEIARQANVSTRQLERLFRQHLGTTPAAYAVNARLDRARAMLLQSRLTVTEIGIACGFVSASHFSAAFRRRFGHPPRDERPRSLAAA